jgi:hypothetical protein
VRFFRAPLQTNAIGSPSFNTLCVPYKVNPATGNLLFTDINGNDTENPTNADRRLTNKIGCQYIKVDLD